MVEDTYSEFLASGHLLEWRAVGAGDMGVRCMGGGTRAGKLR